MELGWEVEHHEDEVSEGRSFGRARQQSGLGW